MSRSGCACGTRAIPEQRPLLGACSAAGAARARSRDSDGRGAAPASAASWHSTRPRPRDAAGRMQQQPAAAALHLHSSHAQDSSRARGPGRLRLRLVCPRPLLVARGLASARAGCSMRACMAHAAASFAGRAPRAQLLAHPAHAAAWARACCETQRSAWPRKEQVSHAERQRRAALRSAARRGVGALGAGAGPDAWLAPRSLVRPHRSDVLPDTPSEGWQRRR